MPDKCVVWLLKLCNNLGMDYAPPHWTNAEVKRRGRLWISLVHNNAENFVPTYQLLHVMLRAFRKRGLCDPNVRCQVWNEGLWEMNSKWTPLSGQLAFSPHVNIFVCQCFQTSFYLQQRHSVALVRGFSLQWLLRHLRTHFGKQSTDEDKAKYHSS